MTKAIAFKRAGSFNTAPIGSITLEHDARQIRRKLLTMDKGDDVLVDLPATTALEEGDALVMEDGGLITIHAANEQLFEITANSPEHLSQLCWHIGNRHLPAQIEQNRILIQSDHVIRDMLIGLGAKVIDITAPFIPQRGAYHSHGDHGHHH